MNCCHDRKRPFHDNLWRNALQTMQGRIATRLITLIIEIQVYKFQALTFARGLGEFYEEPVKIRIMHRSFSDGYEARTRSENLQKFTEPVDVLQAMQRFDEIAF